MSLTTTCKYCNKTPEYICTLCGKFVCPTHFNKLNHTCTTCSAGKQMN